MVKSDPGFVWNGLWFGTKGLLVCVEWIVVKFPRIVCLVQRIIAKDCLIGSQGLWFGSKGVDLVLVERIAVWHQNGVVWVEMIVALVLKDSGFRSQGFWFGCKGLWFGSKGLWFDIKELWFGQKGMWLLF